MVGSRSTNLSSPEAALLLAENYARVNFKPTNIDAENSMGAILWRDEEDPSIISPFEDIILEYTSLEMKKYFGLTLNDYLELNNYEVDTLKKVAKKLKEEYDKITKSVQKDVANERNKMKMDMNAIENLEEEL